MLRLSRILAPTDFSGYSDHALRFAAEMARQFGAKLFLLHVVSNEALEGIAKAHVPPYPVDRVYEDLTQEIHEQFVKHVPSELRKSVETEFLVLPGVPFLEIIRVARLKGVDLIVMATHGRTGLSHALMGSVTEKVVRKAPCPVVSIRPEGVEAEAIAA
ncbi:MAG TPA: universal stress protein [Candidatus Methylomirabilis sp.]|nr:universal stress protein [Candidatus Methylomirabilis sp.]